MKAHLQLIVSITISCWSLGSFAQGTWVQKANFPGTARYDMAGFSIGTKGYIGTGTIAYGGPNNFNDFWEWDQASNAWTQKANLPGAARFAAVGFSIGNKGYIGTGWNGNAYFNDFYEYDPSTNVWVQVANLPGDGRLFAVGFSLGNKGYVGTGKSSGMLNDFWEFDPSLNTWLQKANFPAGGRWGAVGFSIGSMGYIGTGADNSSASNCYHDLWEWNSLTNVWTQKANMPAVSRSAGSGFSIGTNGYVGLGQTGQTFYNDIWKWDQLTDSWVQETNFGGGVMAGTRGFTIGCYAYLGTGVSSSNTSHQDFWEFHDDANLTCTLLPISLTFFDAHADKKNNTILCEWATESEINNNYFTIEKSRDGIDWEEVMKVSAAGNSASTRNYSEIDAHPYNGTSYYRLKQTDYDGAFTYSEVRVVEVASDENDVLIFPNPATVKLTIRFAAASGLQQVAMINCLGQRENLPSYSEDDKIILDISDLNTGAYFLQLKNGNKTEVREIIVE
ncbi:MAG TPA: kelch repeat-containing protein [Chitinophagales bacterium]|nr:kelch repeat-containing protein [Chitinophagales bacterium]